MKKSLIVLIGLLAILAVGISLLIGKTDAKHLERTPVTIDLPDTFEK